MDAILWWERFDRLIIDQLRICFANEISTLESWKHDGWKKIGDHFNYKTSRQRNTSVITELWNEFNENFVLNYCFF